MSANNKRISLAEVDGDEIDFITLYLGENRRPEIRRAYMTGDKKHQASLISEAYAELLRQARNN